jgi:hypothetical protein
MDLNPLAETFRRHTADQIKGVPSSHPAPGNFLIVLRGTQVNLKVAGIGLSAREPMFGARPLKRRNSCRRFDPFSCDLADQRDARRSHLNPRDVITSPNQLEPHSQWRHRRWFGDNFRPGDRLSNSRNCDSELRDAVLPGGQ